MLLDVVAPVEPIVLAQQRHPIAAARQADREIQPVGGRQQIGPQAEVIRDKKSICKAKSRQAASVVGSRGRCTRLRISSRAVVWAMPVRCSVIGSRMNAAKRRISSRSLHRAAGLAGMVSAFTVTYEIP